MKAVFLRDIADIQTGPFGNQLHQEDYVVAGTPIVTVEHLGKRRFTTQNLPMVSDADKQRLQKYILHKGDIVFSRVGSVDRCSFVEREHDGWMFSGRCLRVRPLEMVDSEYLYYYFCGEETKQFVRNIAVGATMPSINTKLLGEVPIALPDMETQKKIAAIVSSIDHKIEINEEINDNLLQQLQAIYQQIFDSASRNDGVLSDICSYSQRRVAVASLTLESYYSTENMLPEKAGAVSASSLPTIVQTTGCAPGDVLISNIRPYFKKIVYCRSECGCSTDVLCFVPMEPCLSPFLFSTLYDDRFFDYMVAGSKGTKMPRGDKQQIMAYPVVKPSNTQLERFNALGKPILAKIESSNQENKRLSAIRDALLPKLMSGEIDVSSITL